VTEPTNQSQYKTNAEPAVIIERPRSAHGINSGGLEEFQLSGWVKMSAKFCGHIKKLRGAKLAIWLCLALTIDENGECGLTQKELCALTDYSHTEVINSVRELDEMGFLSVDRSGKRNLYRPVYVAKGKGNNPIVKKLDSTPLDSLESSLAREKISPTSSKKEQEYKKPKISLPPNSDIGFAIAAGMSSEQIAQENEQVNKTMETASLYESCMGYNPLPWWNDKDLQRLLRFLEAQTPDEIRQFSEWSKRKFSTFDPAKARMNPLKVIEFWPLSKPETQQPKPQQPSRRMPSYVDGVMVTE
jgi:hypothetical protein